jgi:hypothetical protein
MEVLLGQILFTSFIGSGFQFVLSPSITLNVEQIFRKQILDIYWVDHTPPPKDWRAAYILQLEESKTLFGWAYNDGQDDSGRDDAPYFLAYQLSLPLDEKLVGLLLAFLGRGPETAPSRATYPLILNDIIAPNLWSYTPQRPGVRIDSLASENIYNSLVERKAVKLFVVAPSEPLVFEFDEQICEQLTLILAQYLGTAPKIIIGQLPPRIRFWYYSRYVGPNARIVVRQTIEETASVFEPEQRVLQVINRLAEELDTEPSKREFKRRVKAVLGINSQSSWLLIGDGNN